MTISSTKRDRPSFFNIVGCILAFVAVVSGYSPIMARQITPHVRTISYGLGRRIVDRLLPDDEIVLITREFDTVVFSPEPTAVQVIEDAVGMADLVAIVDTRDVTGFLVDDDTWINTRVVGTAQEVLSSSKGMKIGRGQQLEIRHSGGEVRVGKVLVRAGYKSAVQPRRRYLVFLAADPATAVLNILHTPLLVENGKLVNPRQAELPNDTHDPLHGMALSEVTKEIRRLTKK